MNLLRRSRVVPRVKPLRKVRHFACASDIELPVKDIKVSVPNAPVSSRLKRPTKQIFSVVCVHKTSLMCQTPGARSQLLALLQGKDPPAKVIRVGTKAGGCNGWVYTMELMDKPPVGDEVVQEEGVTIAVDPKALLAIVGTEMDWVSNKIKQEFVFSNPNATSSCGCGESFSIN